jgi:hypothetical protein
MEVDLLSNVNESEVFKLCDGRILKNLNDLLEALKTMGADIFAHHVIPERNDFSNWVKSCVGDGILADRLLNAGRQDKAYRLVFQRIEELTTRTGAPVQQPENKEIKGEFVDFLLGLVIGFIIGLIIKTLV